MRILVTGGSGFIGTNHVERLLAADTAVLSVDTRQPQIAAHRPVFAAIDLHDTGALRRAIGSFRPSHVIHYAARTDTLSDREADYATNIEATRSLIASLDGIAAPARVVFVSTQFVHQAAHFPSSDTEFVPYTAYGRSKVGMEQLIRAAGLRFPWVIVRPTNIWGPWHPRYPREFWRVLRKGFYLHPGAQPVIRSFGYVANVIAQIETMLHWPDSAIDGRVFYVGDPPIDLRLWVDGFSRHLCGRPVRVVPRAMIRAAARLGDLLQRAGITPPVTTSRYMAMTIDNPAPMEATYGLLGQPSVALDDAIAATVDWLRTQDPGFWGARRAAAAIAAPARALSDGAGAAG